MTQHLKAPYPNLTHCFAQKSKPQRSFVFFAADFTRVIKVTQNFILFAATAGKPVCNLFQRASRQLSQAAPSA